MIAHQPFMSDSEIPPANMEEGDRSLSLNRARWVPGLFQKSLLTALAILSVFTAAIAQDIPAKTNALVNDFAGLLSIREQQALERKLVVYNDSTSIQIAVVTIKSLEGADDFDYAYRLAESWGIGQKDTDNGVLVFVAQEDRKLRILTGRGSEVFLTDAMSRRIIETVLVPAFRDQQYYNGLDRATGIIMDLGKGEYSGSGGGDGEFPIAAVIFIFLVILFLIIIFNANSGGGDDDGGYYRDGRYEGPARRRGGNIIIFPGGGGGGWSSGGGGGFGGFGGGSFGGGGAGGSW